MSKVLHIIENFNGQSTENWLLQIMRHQASLGKKIDWTFYAALGQPGLMDNSIRELGGKIIYSPFPLRDKLRFLIELRKFIYQGKFDILHSHHDIVSSVYFLASLGLPLKKRIVHVHNTSLSIPTPSLLKKVLWREPMRQACLRLADNVVGVSNAALEAFLNGRSLDKSRDLVIHCGINTMPFHLNPPNRIELLSSLDLPVESRVLLFVGRMTEYKNPCFVVDILENISKIDPTICAIFAGSGPLEASVMEMARNKSLEDRVRVIGWQGDIPSLMRSCDMLICPGLEEPKEGLGLVVVEAQAAGIPVLMSLGVPEEAIVVPKLVKVLSLKLGAKVWADIILDVINGYLPNRYDSLALVENSSFAINQSADNIKKLYEI